MIEDDIIDQPTTTNVDTYRTDAAWIQALNHTMVQCLKNQIPMEQITAVQIEQIHDLSTKLYSLLSSKLEDRHNWSSFGAFVDRMAKLPPTEVK